MRNLLTEHLKKQLRSEYRLRLLVMVAALLSVLLLMGNIFLIPSYVLSNSRKQAVENRVEFVEQGLALREEEVLVETLANAQSELSVLSSLQERTMFSDRLTHILESKPQGIRVESMFYTVREGGESTLTLSGSADTRDALLSFERILKAEPSFTSVTLPVSNLAEDRDISFAITIKGRF